MLESTMKPHPDSSMQQPSDADSICSRAKGCFSWFSQEVEWGCEHSQGRDRDLSVGISITSSTGWFKLLHAHGDGGAL